MSEFCHFLRTCASNSGFHAFSVIFGSILQIVFRDVGYYVRALVVSFIDVLKACINGLRSQNSPKILSNIRGKKIAEIVQKREARS